jgi:transposase
MRCLKRYAARQIYRQITNPLPAPNNSDLRRMRTEPGVTITTVARELGQWVSIISRLERGHIERALVGYGATDVLFSQLGK